MECDKILDIRPPNKSNIRYHTPIKIKYISDIKPPKKSNIRYQGTPFPFHPPPPHCIASYLGRIIRILLQTMLHPTIIKETITINCCLGSFQVLVSALIGCQCNKIFDNIVQLTLTVLCLLTFTLCVVHSSRLACGCTIGTQ